MTSGRSRNPRAESVVDAPGLDVERTLLRDQCSRLACIDEVGRGALAGPVTIGVVVIDAGVQAAPVGVRDSKELSPPQRKALVPAIEQWCSAFAVGHASNSEIDDLGIIGALRLAGQRALAAIGLPAPDLVLLDGSHDWLTEPAPDLFAAPSSAQSPRVVMRVKADRDCAAVAAASVLAKVARDELMQGYHQEFAVYGWAQNKGYASPAHQQALREHGPSPLHRVSWRLPGSSTAGSDQGFDPQ